MYLYCVANVVTSRCVYGVLKYPKKVFRALPKKSSYSYSFMSYLFGIGNFDQMSEMTYSTRYLIQSPKTKTQFKYEGILYYRSKAKPMRFDLLCVSVCGHEPRWRQRRRQRRQWRGVRRRSFVLKAGGFFYPLVMPRVGRR